ncbi:MAG: hypothetical protein HDS68_02415 [Bacteroidales bacterium]|nr:hypothetical protein [Bacteroidales bacterium]
MNQTNRARIILALKIFACLCLFGIPLASWLGTPEYGDYGFIDFVIALAEGAIAAVLWLALAIIVEAAHWYITEKENSNEQ